MTFLDSLAINMKNMSGPTIIVLDLCLYFLASNYHYPLICRGGGMTQLGAGWLVVLITHVYTMLQNIHTRNRDVVTILVQLGGTGARIRSGP